MESLNYKSLTVLMAEKLEKSLVETRGIVEIMINELSEIMRQRGEINFKTFGKFKALYKKAKTGFNPLTKKKFKVGATWKPNFKMSKKFFD